MIEEHDSDRANHIVRIRYNPQARHDSAIRKIEEVIRKCQHGRGAVVFTKEDRTRIYELMGGRVKKRTKKADSDDTADSDTADSDATSDDARQAV